MNIQGPTGDGEKDGVAGRAVSVSGERPSRQIESHQMERRRSGRLRQKNSGDLVADPATGVMEDVMAEVITALCVILSCMI